MDLQIDKNEFLRSFSVRPAKSFGIFVGAGCSVTSGVPSAQSLIWEFKKVLYCEHHKIKPEKFKDLESVSNRQKIQSHFNLQKGFPREGDPNEYAFYFEKLHSKSIDRKFLIQKLVANINPSIGFKCLGSLFISGKIDHIWTTNFDDLIEQGINSLGHSFQFKIISPDNSHQVDDNFSKFPVVIKFHGDYRYDSLQNTEKETQKLDEKLREYFVDVSTNIQGLIVIGYNGADQSILNSLEEAAKTEKPFPLGLIWAVRKGSKPSQRVVDLIKSVNDKNGLSGFIEIDSFDEFTYELYGATKLNEPTIENIAQSLFEKNKSFTTPQAQPNSEMIKLNAFPIKKYPKTVYSFKTKLQHWEELRETIKETSIVAAFHRKLTYAFGEAKEVEDVFYSSRLSDISLVDVEEDWLGPLSAFFLGMLYDLIDIKLKKDFGLKRISSSRRYYSESKTIKGPDIPGGCNAFEAFEIQITRIGNDLFLLLLPTVELIGINNYDDKKEVVGKLLAQRYNRQFNEKLNMWRMFLSKEQEEIKFAISDFEIIIDNHYTAGGYKTIPNIVYFQGSFSLAEPKLQFSITDPNYLQTHPLKGLKGFGPYDKSFESNPSNGSVKLALITPAEGFEKIVKHLTELNKSMPCTTEVDYLIEYPGFNKVFGEFLEIPTNPKDKLFVSIETNSIKNIQLIDFYELMKKKIDYFETVKGDFDVLVIYFPKEWDKYRELKTETSYFDFHDSIKVYCAKRNIRVQFVEDKSIEYKDQGKVKWWLSLALHVKSGGIPWKNKTDTENTAYIGISYAIKKSGENTQVVIGSSQLFDSSGQGLRFVLHPIENPVYINRNPYMSKEDARKLINELKNAYYRMNPNAKLEKLVIHKTTPFTQQEMEGISLATSGIDDVELIQIQQSFWRGIRSSTNNGKQQAHFFPVQRGTTIQLDDTSFLLWTHGSVTDSQIAMPGRNYYQGKRGIPAPLLIKRYQGQEPIEEVSQSILNLTKMNWNGGQLYKVLPVTLDFSESLSQVAKQAEALQNYPYDFRFFM